MASNLGTLTIDVIARVGSFVDGLEKGKRSSKKFKNDVEKDLKDVGKALVGFGIAGAAATALLIKSSIDNADALLEQSQAYGVNIELLSGYQLGLEQAGSSSDDFARGLKALSNAVDSESEALDRLQISTKKSDGTLKSSIEILDEIANRFASMPDGITKTALANDLLGKSGVTLVPFLNQGAAGLKAMREEAESLGKVISLETAQAADQFNDNLATLKAVVTGTGNELAQTLLPSLVEFTNIIKDPQTQQGIKDIVQGLADIAIGAAKIPSFFRFMGEELAAFTSGAALGDIPRLSEELGEINEKLAYAASSQMFTDERVAEWEAEKQRLETLIELSQEFAESQSRTIPAATNAPANIPAPFVPGAAGSGKDAAKEWENEMEAALDKAEQAIAKIQAIDDARMQLNAGMEREIALYGETSQAAILAYDLAHGELSALNEETKAYSISLAEQLDLEKKRAEEAANDEQFEATAAGLQKQIDLLGNTSKAAELLYDVQHGGYDQFKEDQQDTLVLLAQELEEREKMLDEFEKAEKAKAEIMEEFLNNTQNILADFLFDPFEDGLDGMVDQFANMLKRLAAEAVAADIMKYFTSGGGSTGFFGSLIGAFSGAKDSGGTIGAGQWGIVGEIGPEIVRGPASVTSRKDTAAMLGGKTMNFGNININLPGVTNREEADIAASTAARQFMAGVQQAGRYR